ncbi:MAG: Homoserine kinase [Chlamydiia bacterium]|nr:Homoserine kinase [Chlamydiia bacterium]
MSIVAKKRRTWKRAPVKKVTNLIKENNKQRIEKVVVEGKSALMITYKNEMTLKNLTYLKKITEFLSSKALPFSKLISFDRSTHGYRGIWSYCEGKHKAVWSHNEYAAFGEFLGKMHLVTKNYKENSVYRLPLILRLREKYEELKSFIPSSFDNFPHLLEIVEKKWPLFLSTGLVHTDLFTNNVLFKHNEVSGILQNHNFQTDVLLYDLTPVAKSLYFSPCTDIKEKECAFFTAYNLYSPLAKEEILALPVLTSAKLLSTSLNMIENHLKEKSYNESQLNAAAISLIHAEKALLLNQ